MWTWRIGELPGVVMTFTVCDIEAMAIESSWIFPLNMVIFHSYVNVYQRVYNVGAHSYKLFYNPIKYRYIYRKPKLLEF